METKKETELLSRVIANHLFLAQFEPLRALLLSLRKRDPELALSILRKIVLEGGRIDGVLFSNSCSSPSHLAWLSALELLKFDSSVLDPEVLRLKVEFLLLIQLVSSKAPSNEDENVLNKLLDLGLKRLKSDVDASCLVSDEELKSLWRLILENPVIFDAICANVQRQVQLSVNEREGESSGSGADELEALVRMQRSVQFAHLDALREKLKVDDFHGAYSHVRFLHRDYGVEDDEYKMVLQDVIKMAWLQNTCDAENWKDFRNKMMLIYAEALSSGCPEIVQTIQVIQDEVFSDEIEQYKASDAHFYPLPLQKYLHALHSGNTGNVDDASYTSITMRSCMRELYHYARISGVHILECVMDAALSAIRREQLQEASDVLSLFPLLQPLVAVLGWDLLSGKTAVRRTLMQLLWTSKSQVLRLEEYSLYGKQTDEISCVEYLCDLLCFRLDLASFVACVNSGRSWNSKSSLLFGQKEHTEDEKDTEDSDPFVENFVLERLAVQSPMRVLFDVVPGIKFQDAIELISLQPIASTSAAWKRMQDIELLHMRYALESAVLALGAMEQCLGDENEYQFRLAIMYLKDLQIHMEAISNTPRKIFMVSIITSLLHIDELSIDVALMAPYKSHLVSRELPSLSSSSEGGNKMVVSFAGMLLDILHHNLPAVGTV